MCIQTREYNVDISKNALNRDKHTDIQNRLVVVKGEGRRGVEWGVGLVDAHSLFFIDGLSGCFHAFTLLENNVTKILANTRSLGLSILKNLTDLNCHTVRNGQSLRELFSLSF